MAALAAKNKVHIQGPRGYKGMLPTTTITTTRTHRWMPRRARRLQNPAEKNKARSPQNRRSVTTATTTALVLLLDCLHRYVAQGSEEQAQRTQETQALLDAQNSEDLRIKQLDEKKKVQLLLKLTCFFYYTSSTTT